MKRRKTRLNDDSHSYWQSAADIMSGLLLILLLVIMLFMVRILFFSANDMTGETDHEYEQEYDSVRDDETNKSHDQDYEHEHDKDYDEMPEATGGGDGQEEETTTEYAEYEAGYAAVLVRVIDVETGNLIQEAGAKFTLYGEQGSSLTLRTFYPEEIVYKEFETREDGTFFLPQKIHYGDYNFRNIIAPAGYEPAADVNFSVDKDYDWSEPLIVDIPIGPEQNSTSIQLVDSKGDPVRLSGDFNVYADQDIVTGDGTLRHKKNDLVGTIHCDNNGSGTSDLMYLGNYRIETIFDQDFYVGNSVNVITVHSKSSDESKKVYEIVCEKTAINLQLSDELNNTLSISGAEYQLTDTSTGESRRDKTDEKGRLIFTDLLKDRTYELMQVSSVSDYYADDTIESIYVDKNGYIDGNTSKDFVKTNRLIRISISIVDTITGRSLSGKNVNIYDKSGNLFMNYTSNGQTKLIEGIPYGQYRIKIEGSDTEEWIDVSDMPDQQEFSVKLIERDTLIFIGACVIVLLIIIAIIIYLNKDRKKKDGRGKIDAK